MNKFVLTSLLLVLISGCQKESSTENMPDIDKETSLTKKTETVKEDIAAQKSKAAQEEKAALEAKIAQEAQAALKAKAAQEEKAAEQAKAIKEMCENTPKTNVFFGYLASKSCEGHAFNRQQVVESFRGEESIRFIYELPVTNMQEAVVLLQRLGMFEVDEYNEKINPLPSGRKILFDLPNNTTKDYHVSLNDNPIKMELRSSSKKETIYAGKTSKERHTVMFEEKVSYSDEIRMELLYSGEELNKLVIRSNFHGLLSEDGILTNDPTNKRSKEELKKETERKTGDDLCIGVQSTVVLYKSDNGLFKVEFTAGQITCIA